MTAINPPFLNLAQDAKAAQICKHLSHTEQDESDQAHWDDLRRAYQSGGECHRDTVLWMLERATQTLLRYTGRRDLNDQDAQAQADALYLRRLYP